MTLVLTAFVEHRHDDGDPARLAGDGVDDTLQVGEMIVGTHRIFGAVHFIGNAVIVHIGDDVDVAAPQRFVENGFSFPVSEALALRRDDKGLASAAAPPLMQVGVDLLDERLAPRHTDH